MLSKCIAFLKGQFTARVPEVHCKVWFKLDFSVGIPLYPSHILTKHNGQWQRTLVWVGCISDLITKPKSIIVI